MSRTLRILTAGVLTVAIAAVTVWGFRQWRAWTQAKQERMALNRAEQFLRDAKPAEALNLAESFLQARTNSPWQKIELEALVALPNLPRLVGIFQQTPERILAHETASLLLAHTLLHAHKSADCARLRQAWRGREQRLDAWLAVDTDTLVQAGKLAEAESSLRSRTLPGTQDVTRLTRLALLTAHHDLPEAWKLLGQAAALDPRNSDVRSFRGQVLEVAGRPGQARMEYVAALVATPHNPMLRDQLADFYLRHHYLDLALDTWKENLNESSPDFMLLKAHFLARVLRPVGVPMPTQSGVEGLEPLVRQIAGLKPGGFFARTAFDQLPRARFYTSSRQEVFWLRLLDALQTRQEKQAADQLIAEPERLRSWDPDLAAALSRILYYRQKQSLDPPWLTFTSDLPETNRPTLFVALEKAARQERGTRDHRPLLDVEMADLLRGSNAFSAAFLAAGWREAALQLRPQPRLLRGEPEWFTSSFAQALRINRNPPTALAFLGEGELLPSSALLRAEILAELGRREEARQQLQPLAKLNSGAGFRAAYLLALDAAENRRPDLARQRVAEQPLLAKADAGQELLARLALAEGRTNETETIYRKIVKTSVEAKAWFARRAFADRNWKEARQLTNELLELLPDSPQLRENLLAIDRAEAKR